jgi:hypothetical protein
MPGSGGFGIGVWPRLGSCFRAEHSRQSVTGFGWYLGVKVEGQSGVNSVHHLRIGCSGS